MKHSDLEIVRRVVKAVFPAADVKHEDSGDCESFVTSYGLSLSREKNWSGPGPWIVEKAVSYGGSMDEPPGVDAVTVREVKEGITHAAAALVEAMASVGAWAEIENIGIDEMIAEQREWDDTIPALDEAGREVG
jgi:hypothetical protein